MRKKKNLQKILQITIFEMSKNFTVIVSKMKVLGQKNWRGGGAKRPLPSLYRVKSSLILMYSKNLNFVDFKMISNFTVKENSE